MCICFKWIIVLKGIKGVIMDIFYFFFFRKIDKFEFCCIVKLFGLNCLVFKDLFFFCDDFMVNIIFYVCIWILGSIVLVGNVFVLMWWMKIKSDNKVYLLLLFNLVIVDFLMGIYLIIIVGVDVFYCGRYFIYNVSWKWGLLC